MEERGRRGRLTAADVQLVAPAIDNVTMPAEGQINRLKPLKRAMSCRNKLDVLRPRFLLAAGSTKLREEPLQWADHLLPL